MRTKALIASVAAMLIAAAYGFGYYSEHRPRRAAENQVAALQQRVTAAEARLRLGALLGQVLTLKELALRQDYGQALERSSQFFNTVRTEMLADVGLQERLNEVLGERDKVTAALAKGDPTVVEILHGIELRLRRA